MFTAQQNDEKKFVFASFKTDLARNEIFECLYNLKKKHFFLCYDGINTSWKHNQLYQFKVSIIFHLN